MPDHIDRSVEIADKQLARSIEAARQPVPEGVSGECVSCFEESPHLIAGRCTPCRDRVQKRRR